MPEPRYDHGAGDTLLRADTYTAAQWLLDGLRRDLARIAVARWAARHSDVQGGLLVLEALGLRHTTQAPARSSGDRGRVRECAGCHQTRRIKAYDRCRACYERHSRPYRPSGNPRTPKTADVIAARVEEYGRLRAAGYSVRAAAEQVGVNERTGNRYEARLRASREAA